MNWQQMCNSISIPQPVIDEYKKYYTRISQIPDLNINVNQALNQLTSDIKRTLCEFLKDALIRKELAQEFVNLFNNLTDYSAHRRFIASIYLYVRMNNTIPDPKDKFLYLCMAVEAARRFESTPNQGAKRDFKEFFLKNLSDSSKELIAQKFKILWSQNDSHWDPVDAFFEALYQKRSQFVHEGKPFDMSISRDVVFYDDPFSKRGLNYAFNMITFGELRRFYEEALLNEFSGGNND